ncbi:MAG: peptidase M23 [Crocinitomicaceae bacterium]|nr:peptidase M23 [Crocinitomicaceae bacterium]|tara:strand:- start:8712 stop:9929 length:1218 start_codon:yes stop_codon:yes gene_type:complete
MNLFPNKSFAYSLLIALFVGIGLLASAQTKEEYEKKKENLKKDIEYKNKLLKETTANKKASLNQLVILNKKIKEREELIATIKNEISLIDKKVKENEGKIDQLEQDIETLKDEYAEMIRFAYKTRNNLDRLMFVFAADDFNQAYKRVRYLQQYSDYRKEQAEAIRRKEEDLKAKNQELTVQRQEKEKLYGNEDLERMNLAVEKTEQNKVFSELQDKERDLRAEIKKKEKERQALQKAIDEIIKAEMEKMAKGSSKSEKFVLTPEAKALASNFAANKGKLPWPVEEGVIVSRFGINSHEVLKEVKTKNNGVTISTRKGAPVRAVFEGEVSAIFLIPGSGKAVMVRHGDYISVYAKLDEVYVKQGDKVATKQKIGTVMTSNNKTEVQFELRKSFDLINPEYWLYNAR